MNRSPETDATASGEIGSRTRAFTVIETWQSGQATDGRLGGFKTRPFAFNQGPWALVWALSGESLRICVRDEDTGFGAPETGANAVNVAESGQGISYLSQAGTFSLEIAACGDWVVKVAAIDELL